MWQRDDGGDAVAFAGAVLAAVWAGERDIADRDTVLAIAQDLGIDGTAYVPRVEAALEIRARESEQAIERGLRVLLALRGRTDPDQDRCPRCDAHGPVPLDAVDLLQRPHPDGLEPQRPNRTDGGAGARLMIGVIIGLAYYLGSETLANSGQVYDLDPVLVNWSPSVILLVVTILVLARVR